MRRLSSPFARHGLLLAAALFLAAPARADDAKFDDAKFDDKGKLVSLEGKWKLVMHPFGYEMLVLEAKTVDGKQTAELLDAAQNAGPAKFESLTVDLGRVTLTIDNGGPNKFVGNYVAAGKQAGKVLGSYKFRGTSYAASLETADADKTAPWGASPIAAKLSSLMRTEKDAKGRVEKLATLASETSGPQAAPVYLAILQSAADAELSVDQVADNVKKAIAEVEPFGGEVVADTRLSIAKALTGKKPYAEFTLGLAQETLKGLGKVASLDQQAAAHQLVLASAKLADKVDVAKETAATLAKLDAALDEEYHKTVPPFKPETYAGRAKPDQNRVVLLELFTGAQCPPCVAADVGFDALLHTYGAAELTTLQYHLHIPGPDPLTNADSEARAKYYGVRGTPSTYFNGVSLAGGGGEMANSQMKYNQFREIIDGQLAGVANGKINLKVARSGSKITIRGLAQASLAPDAKKAKGDDANKDDAKKGEKNDEAAGGDKKDDDKPAEPKLRLRLALTEEAIRYVGGNKLRFHHHVVRGFVGGVDGIELLAGEGKVDQTFDLDELKGTLGGYLDEYAKERPFPNPLPEIDFEGLSLVAFVQNDADKSVLHSVVLPVPAAK